MMQRLLRADGLIAGSDIVRRKVHDVIVPRALIDRVPSLTIGELVT